MTVVGKIWFSPSSHQNKYVKRLWDFFKKSRLPFPFDKANAIRVTTYEPGNPTQPIFPLRSGESTDFTIPDFAKHHDAWDVANLGVEIGPIEKVNHSVVDEFNELVMAIFNMATGNMLQVGNVLTWNVWFLAPNLVDIVEWRNHAEKWRDSIDTGHGSPDDDCHGNPDCSATHKRFSNGARFCPVDDLEKMELEKIEAFIMKHL